MRGVWQTSQSKDLITIKGELKRYMDALFWLRKSPGAGFILICGFGIAYGMDHRRTPHVQIRASPERNVVPSEVRLRVSTDIVSSVAMIAWDYEGDGTFDVEGSHLYS